jgi:hypothetical protein
MRDSAVGIATAYGPDDGGVGARVPVGSRIFFASSLESYSILFSPHDVSQNRHTGAPVENIGTFIP